MNADGVDNETVFLGDHLILCALEDEPTRPDPCRAEGALTTECHARHSERSACSRAPGSWSCSERAEIVEASAPDRASGFLALPRPILTGSHAETARASMPCRWYSTTKWVTYTQIEHRTGVAEGGGSGGRSALNAFTVFTFNA